MRVVGKVAANHWNDATECGMNRVLPGEHAKHTGGRPGLTARGVKVLRDRTRECSSVGERRRAKAEAASSILAIRFEGTQGTRRDQSASRRVVQRIEERLMSQQRVGTCSICGGTVEGYRGVWMSINPPPPDKCSQCGAVAQSDVIKMHPAPPSRPRTNRWSNN